MDTSLNLNSGGQQFELQFSPIDPNTYESPNGYSVSGPTRSRRFLRVHTTTPYSRNSNSNNRSTEPEVKKWLRAIINSLIPDFLSKFLGLDDSRRENRRSETSPRPDQKNDNEMDIDGQQHESSNSIQERLVQSNRIFAEPIQSINNANGSLSRSRRRSETTQNNSIKRKRSDTSIEAVEENLRRQAQIEDQNHKPDLKELYFKTINPNWYKPFKNNPDNYPKFSSSSRVTSDTYGPDQNLSLPKESPPLKKFRPSVTPTSHWFDYYPDKVDKVESAIDKKRTENIVEKRKVEEKTIEKEKAYKSKKGKGKESEKEKSSGTILTPPNRISPLKDQNYFSDIQKPVLATLSKKNSTSTETIKNQSQIPSTIAISPKTPSPTEDKIKNIVATPETTAQNVKSPSSMESIVYTNGNKDDNRSPIRVTNTSATKDKIEERQEASIVNNSSASPAPEPKSDVLVNTQTPNEKDKESKESIPLETKSIPSIIVKNGVGSNGINLLSESIPSTPFTPLTSAVPSLFNNVEDNTQLPKPATPFPDDTRETEKNSTEGEKEKKEEAKLPSSQPQTKLVPDSQSKKNGQGKIISFTSLTADNKADSPLASPFTSPFASPFTSPFASTAVSTTATPITAASTFSFSSTSTSTVPTFNVGSFNSSMFSNDNNGMTEKSDKLSKTYKPYSSSMNSRNKKNKRSYSATGSGLENETNMVPNQKIKTASTDQSSTMLLVSVPGTFNFTVSKGSSSDSSLFGSGNENTSSQPTFNFGGFNGGTQQQTSASTFGTSVTSNSPSLFNATSAFGSSQASTSNTGFNMTTPTSMFTAPASVPTFGFGTNAASTPKSTSTSTSTSIGFMNPTPSGNPFGASQNSGFGTPNIMQSGQPNNSFQVQNNSNMTQQGQQLGLGFGPSQNVVNNFSQQNQQQRPPFSFNFNEMSGIQGFNNPNQNPSFNPMNANPNQISFSFSGSDIGQQQGNQMVNGRRIRQLRKKKF